MTTRQKIRGSIIGGAAVYLLLWLLTAVVGVTELEEQTVRRLRDELAKLRPNVEIHDLSRMPVSPPPPHPWYRVVATTPAPFLIRMRSGAEMAPLMGSGSTDWYVWFFGFRMHVATTEEWIS